MGFIKSPHIKGKIFVPSKPPDDLKKHACEDCFSCQGCSDGRCLLCREKKVERPEAQPPGIEKDEK